MSQPITEHALIQQSIAQECDLYYDAFLGDEDQPGGVLTQATFCYNQQVNRAFQEDLNPWYPESSRRGQEEGVQGIIQ